MDVVKQILDDLGSIRNPDGSSLKIITKPDAKAYQMLSLAKLTKIGTFSVSDQAVVQEAKNLARMAVSG